MTESWKQVWEDFINALKGEDKPKSTSAEPETPPGPSAPLEAASESSPPEADSLASATVGVAPESTASALSIASPVALVASEPSAVAETEPPLTPRQIWLSRIQTTSLYLILGVVFLIGLWFSGLNQYWAQWTAPKPPAADVVATFDSGQITTADLEEHFNLLVPEEYREQLRSLETLRLVVQEMVADELARRWAAQQKVDADQTFQHTMEHISENINLDSFNSQLHAGGIPVAESEIQAYYDANRAQFGEQTLTDAREQIRQQLANAKEGDYLQQYIDQLKESASITRNFDLLDVPPPAEVDLQTYYDANKPNFILPAEYTVDMATITLGSDEAAARATADKALLKLRSGADFNSLSTDVPEARIFLETVVAGGGLGPEWDAAVQALAPGDISAVFQAQDTFFIVRLISAQPERAQTLNEVRSQVLLAVQQQQTEAWMNANASKTLFTLKSKQYTLGQFYTEYTELPPEFQAQYVGGEGRKELAERLIDRLVLVADTSDQLLQVENQSLIDQTRLDVLKQMMDQQEVDDKLQVTEEEVQQYYDQNLDRLALPPQFRIRYIRIGLGQTQDEQNAAQVRAAEAYQKLVPGPFQQGADFATIAQEYSEDPETAANGGEYPGWIGETGDPFELPDLHLLHEMLLQLNVNDISQPLPIGDSLYIVQVIESTTSQPLAFEEAKPFIQEFLQQQEHDQLLRDLQERLAKEANVVIYESALEAFFNQTLAQTP